MLFPILSILFISFLNSLQAEKGKEESAQEAIVLVQAGQLESNSLALDGFWEFYPNQLLGASEMRQNPTRSLVEIPSWWGAYEGQTSTHFGTYRMKVVLPASLEKTSLGLYMPDVYCAYQLQVNGQILGKNGQVGKTKNESVPQWKPETYFFEPAGDTLEIVIQLSNFHHYRTGINNSLRLGRAEHLLSQKNQQEYSQAVLLVGLSILCLLGVVLYISKGKISFVFYSLLCLAWIIRVSFSNQYLVVQWFEEINWHLLVRTEYISMYLSTLFGSLLVGSLFPREMSKVFRIIFLTASVGFTIFTLLVSPMLFTSYVQLYLGLSTALLVSVLVIVTRAYSESRKGAALVFMAASFAVGMFGYVILAYQGVFPLNDIIFNSGFLLQFILSLVAINKRVNNIDKGQDYDLMTFEGATKR